MPKRKRVIEAREPEPVIKTPPVPPMPSKKALFKPDFAPVKILPTAGTAAILAYKPEVGCRFGFTTTDKGKWRVRGKGDRECVFVTWFDSHKSEWVKVHNLQQLCGGGFEDL